MITSARFIGCAACAFFVFGAVFVAESAADERPITNRASLETLSQVLEDRLQAQRTQLYYDLLAGNNLPAVQLNENPHIELMYIDERGHPVYYGVDNLDAAKTISTDDVWPGGSGGFSLDGIGTALGRLGVWDGGAVLTTHQELIGRVTQMDGAGGSDAHATHVAGTMVAAGLDPAAKGMSFAGTLAAYNWNSDYSEMAAAAAEGMNVSNHSYGMITGWTGGGCGDWYWYGDVTISTTEDYRFGFYSLETFLWDEVAYNAPYYTIIKSAGNDRLNVGPDPGEGHWVFDGAWVWSMDIRDRDGGADGYDCIPTRGTAKNIITVGAIEDIPGGYVIPDDVVMAPFSSWGPTDDGRIKPDLVANGWMLYSCINESDTSYDIKVGTSMSAPNLAGSLNLLVRHYENTHMGLTPLSSTMKAVLIGTADEAGPYPGPDYMFGWGLMNTLKAAELIEADVTEPDRIVEGALADGETDEFTFTIDCYGPIRVTLAWTDPPGTSPPRSVNPTTPMLVNDLDLRLVHMSSLTTYGPYVLDPVIPDGPAGTGDNTLDNVEQIYVAAPDTGSYRITVTHKGVLATMQYYSVTWSAEPDVPRLFSVSPVQNELNVPVGADLSVTFNFSLDETTLDSSTFRVHSTLTGLHQGTIGYDHATRTATFDPVDDFAPGEVVTAVITAGIQSSCGYPADSDYVWSFTTGVSEESPGVFAPGSTYSLGEYPIPLSIVAADLDNDGDIDLASGIHGLPAYVAVMMNNGNGTFVAGTTYPVNDWPYSIVAADLDGDGDLDLANTNSISDNISILDNNGDGTFAPRVDYPVGEWPYSVFAADLDGDGDIDLATANDDTDNVSVLLNNGDGSFASQAVYPSNTAPKALSAADLDGDWDLDLVIVHSYNWVSVLWNNSDGTFTTELGTWIQEKLGAVYAADLDGDGDADLAVPHANSEVAVLLNNGDGTFAGPSLHEVCESPLAVIAADLNGDGELDLVTSNVYSNNVSVLLNNGEDIFATQSVYPVEDRPVSVVTADLDGDGDLDLATANTLSGDISVLFNKCGCDGFCDLNLDGGINPLDVVLFVNFVYLNNDLREQMPSCPGNNGDWNCDGHVNPVDVVLSVNYVYLSMTDRPPCDPCACDGYPNDCPPWP